MNAALVATSSRSRSDTAIEIIELRPEEVTLIKTLRNQFRFGEITIIMRDGIPVRLKRITEFAELDRNMP